MLFPLLLVLAVLVVLAYQRLRSPLARIPGPYYSTFTAVWLKYKEFSRARRLYIHDLHEQYGPVVRLGPNEVSCTSPEAVKEIYTSGGSGYDRTEFYDLFKQFNTRTLFSSPPKADHSQRKRILADRYANTNIQRGESLGGLQERAKTFTETCLSTGNVDVYVKLHCYALDGVTHHLFHPYGTNSLTDPKDLEMMKELSYHDSMQRFWLQYYSPAVSSWVEWLLHRPKYAPLANDFVLESSKKPDPAPFTLLSKMQSKGAELPALTIPAESMDHLAAGIDTTGDGLCFLMHELSLPRSMHIQACLQQELLANPGVPFDQLLYLHAVVLEGLRCFPPIPMSFPRYVPVGGRTIDGYYLPEGTIVSAQPYTLHKNEAVFPRPLEFIPERWLEEKGAAERSQLFFAFSSGSRGCLGRHLAMAEMKILLRDVYSQCTTREADDMQGDMEMSDQIISSRPKDQTCKLVFERTLLGKGAVQKSLA